MKRTDLNLSLQESIEFTLNTIKESEALRKEFPWYLRINLETCFDLADMHSFREEFELIETMEDILTEFFEQESEIKKVATFHTRGLQHYLWRLQEPLWDFEDTQNLLLKLRKTRDMDFEVVEDREWNQTMKVLVNNANKRAGWCIYVLE